MPPETPALVPAASRAGKGARAKHATRDLDHIDRVALQWLLATGVCACALLAPELPLWVPIAFALTSIWRYAIERFQLRRPHWSVLYALLGLAVFGVYREYGSIFGRDPGVALLVTLLGLKLLELRSRRDAMVTLFLFYVALAGAFLFSQAFLSALGALAVVALSLVALARAQQALPIRVAFALTGELMLKAVPLLLIMYVLFPRTGGTLWGLPSDAYGGRTGFSSEMRPGSIRSLSESAEVALRVDFLDGAPPPARELYWRGLVLWETDGLSWRRGQAPEGNERLIPRGAPVRYRITLEPHQERWLFALDLPAQAPANARLGAGYTLRSNEPVRERMSYAVTSHTRYDTAPLDIHTQHLALAVPAQSGRVRALAQSLRESHALPEARATALLERFRNEQFFYTLTPPLLGDDPVDEFLFETRRGFCEHYASAFVTVMRAAGVPARVVVGYQGGELNPTGNYLIVRQYDAHAWAEIAIEGRGWVRVDPTAAIAPERIEYGLDAIRRLEAQGLRAGSVGSDMLARALQLPWFERAAHQLRLYWDYGNLAWYRWVIDYREQRQQTLLRRLGFDTIDWTRILLVLGGACVAVLLLYVWWSRRVPRLDPAQRVYLRFCRKLARIGLMRAAHEGPADFCRRASSARPDLAPDIVAVTESYLDLRYGPRARNDDMNTLERTVAAFKPHRQRRHK